MTFFSSSSLCFVKNIDKFLSECLSEQAQLSVVHILTLLCQIVCIIKRYAQFLSSRCLLYFDILHLHRHSHTQIYTVLLTHADTQWSFTGDVFCLLFSYDASLFFRCYFETLISSIPTKLLLLTDYLILLLRMDFIQSLCKKIIPIHF